MNMSRIIATPKATPALAEVSAFLAKEKPAMVKNETITQSIPFNIVHII